MVATMASLVQLVNQILSSVVLVQLVIKYFPSVVITRSRHKHRIAAEHIYTEYNHSHSKVNSRPWMTQKCWLKSTHLTNRKAVASLSLDLLGHLKAMNINWVDEIKKHEFLQFTVIKRKRYLQFVPKFYTGSKFQPRIASSETFNNQS